MPQQPGFMSVRKRTLVRPSLDDKVNTFNNLGRIEARSDFRDPRGLRTRPAANPILDERSVTSFDLDYDTLRFEPELGVLS
jgi:hypothetical protein